MILYEEYQKSIIFYLTEEINFSNRPPGLVDFFFGYSPILSIAELAV